MNRVDMLTRLANGEDPLELSIEKHEDILKSLKQDGIDWDWDMEGGTGNCALCQRFHSVKCEGCPVFERTLNIECLETPYMRFCDAKHVDDLRGMLYYCEHEIRFLKSLRVASKMKKLAITEGDNIVQIDRDDMLSVNMDVAYFDIENEKYFSAGRLFGDFAGHAIELPYDYRWVVGVDEEGVNCLVPLKKR